MGRTIRDYEYAGKMHDVIRKTHGFSIFEHVEDLAWRPVTEPPREGQMVIVSWKGWKVDVGYFVDGMFFHEGWDWAEEFSAYDGWMAMPLPMHWRRIEMFNPYVMIQDANDERAWVCGSYEAPNLFDGAMKIIDAHKQNHVVLCAWVTDGAGRVVFFENYTNVFGCVNNKDVRKENLPDEEDEE